MINPIIFITSTDHGAGYFVRFKATDRTTFSLTVESLKSFVRADQRAFVPELKEWFVRREAEHSLRRWLEYVRGTLGAQVEWMPEGSASGEATAKRSSDQATAFAALHLLPSAPPQLIKAAYRTLAQLHHPDLAGGDGEEMRRINTAFEAITRGLAAA